MGARFVYRPLTAQHMESIGNLVIAEVIARIKRGRNMEDAPAKALKPGQNGRKGYPDLKRKRGLQPIRDLTLTGQTLKSLRVIYSTANKVVIGFDNPDAARIAALNQRRDDAFWFSPANKRTIRELVTAAINSTKLVKVEKVA